MGMDPTPRCPSYWRTGHKQDFSAVLTLRMSCKHRWQIKSCFVSHPHGVGAGAVLLSTSPGFLRAIRWSDNVCALSVHLGSLPPLTFPLPLVLSVSLSANSLQAVPFSRDLLLLQSPPVSLLVLSCLALFPRLLCFLLPVLWLHSLHVLFGLCCDLDLVFSVIRCCCAVGLAGSSDLALIREQVLHVLNIKYNDIVERNLTGVNLHLLYFYGQLLKNKNQSILSFCLSVSWNFTSGISGISGSAEGAFALVGGIFPLSPGGFSPLEPSLLFSPVSMSQSRLLSWKQRKLIALIHCLFLIYTIFFYTVESHWIHQNNKAGYIELCIKQMCEMAHRCNVFYFSDSSKWPPVALMTALQTLLSHSTSIPSQLQCAEVRLQHSWQSYLTTVQIHDESGLCGQIAAKTLLLEKSNKQKKFVLAKKHKKWTLDQWTSALWSGESKIEIFALWGCFSWPKSNQYGQAWDGTKQRAILKNQRVSSLFFPICAISATRVTDLWLGSRDDFALCADFGVRFTWKTQLVVLDDTRKGLEALVDGQRHGCGRHFTDDLNM